MQRVLVTGAGGFVGRALCRSLSAKGYRVLAAHRNLPEVNKSEVTVDRLNIGDISTIDSWNTILKDVDLLVHLAARVHVMKDTANNPLSKFRAINTAATECLAKAAAKNGIKRFIYLSTVKVNGERTGEPGTPKRFTESIPPAPDGPYAISKWEAEQILNDISKTTDMEIVIIRPPLLYGPGVKGNFESMMKYLFRGIPLPFGAIDNRRSLLALANLTDLISTCLTHPNAANQTFLAADDKALSTANLLYLLAKYGNRSNRVIKIHPSVVTLLLTLIHKKEWSQRLCSSLQVDISKARKLLDWTPPVTVEKALRETAEAYLSD